MKSILIQLISGLIVVNGLNLGAWSSSDDQQFNTVNEEAVDDLDFNPLIKSLLGISENDPDTSNLSIQGNESPANDPSLQQPLIEESLVKDSASEPVIKPISSALELESSLLNAEQSIKPISPEVDESASTLTESLPTAPITPDTLESTDAASTAQSTKLIPQDKGPESSNSDDIQSFKPIPQNTKSDPITASGAQSTQSTQQDTMQESKLNDAGPFTSPIDSFEQVSQKEKSDTTSTQVPSSVKDIIDHQFSKLFQMSQTMEQKSSQPNSASSKQKETSSEFSVNNSDQQDDSTSQQEEVNISPAKLDKLDQIEFDRNYATNSYLIKNITSYQFKSQVGASDQVTIFQFALLKEKLLRELKKWLFGLDKVNNHHNVPHLNRRTTKPQDYAVMTEEEKSEDKESVNSAEYEEECFEDEEMDSVTEDSDHTSFISPKYRPNVHERGIENNEIYIRLLSQIIHSLGGTPMDSCRFDFNGKHAPELKLLHRFILSASVSSYGGFIELVTAPSSRQILASILAVRSQELAFYNLEGGGEVMVAPFTDIISVKQALSYLKRFIRNCPLNFPQGTYRTLVISPSQGSPRTKINLAVPRKGDGKVKNGQRTWFKGVAFDDGSDFYEEDDAVEDLHKARGDVLYCAFVFDTFQINTKVSRKNTCSVPRNAIPGICKVYLVKSTQQTITADQGPDIFAGPAYFIVKKTAGNTQMNTQKPPHHWEESVSIINNPPPTQDDDDEETGAADDNNVSSEDSSDM